jgi:uncharacterized membrane protein YagU involved in acid resistance
MQTLLQSMKHRSTLRIILITGFLVASLDALAAIIVYNVSPLNLFQYIASGAVGRAEAFSGNFIYVVLGICFHYFIAYVWTILYVALLPIVKKLPGNKYVNGVLYGALIWMGMNLLVLPLSAIPPRIFNWEQAIIGIAIIIFAVGLPITILIHRQISV